MAEVGRPKAFKSPEDLLSTFKKYKQWVIDNPILVQDYVGKDAEEVERKKQRPLTIEGFENYCFEQGIINDMGDYFANRNDAYTEFSAICRAIKKNIRQDQIEGGMAGIYNPSITQRLNSLVDKSETKTQGTTVIITKAEPNPINESIKG
jgi:hypothetical protein